jgi:hypothetical protein
MVGLALPRSPNITKTSTARFLPGAKLIPDTDPISREPIANGGFFVPLRETEIRAVRQHSPTFFCIAERRRLL